MKKIFSEYGSVVVVVLAVVALITMVTVLTNENGGLNTAFKTIIQEFSDKTSGMIEDSAGGSGSGGSGDAGGSGSLPEVGLTAEEYTWAEIKAISEAGKEDEYFDLGDIKTMTLTDGTVVEMQIVAFDADEKADGSKAGITWISKGIITTHQMNATNDNTGGWASSAMRTWLQGDFYATLPDEVKDVIVSVNKTYLDYNGGSPATQTCTDTIWLPSYREVFGNSSNSADYETSGADYTAFFTDATSRIKNNSSGSAARWWLRSASCNYSSNFRGVNSNGYGPNSSASYTYGVVLGFCM